jgi:Rod binding domain-containing protein
MSPDIGVTLATTKPLAVAAPYPTTNVAAAKKAAQQFEGVFISEFLGNMFEGISTDGPFGGGQGEAMFRSLMLDEYGKQIASSGGFGLADSITRSLLAHQEVQQ